MKTKSEKINDQPKEKVSWKTVLLWVGIYGLIFLICMLISLFCVKAFDNNYRYYPVKGTSMQPTINPDVPSPGMGVADDDLIQDGVFIKVTQNVELNDIVIIKRDPNDDQTIIKRVIAKGGDKVSIAKDSQGFYTVYVIRAGENQIQALQEDYVAEDDKRAWSYHSYETTTMKGSSVDIRYERSFYNTFLSSGNNKVVPQNFNDRTMLFFQLASDEIFYLGDHRSVSRDARANGVAKTTDLVGRVISIIHDAKTLEQEGKLWAVKLKTIFSYYWSNTVDYFAW